MFLKKVSVFIFVIISSSIIHAIDSDKDGISDAIEIQYGYNPNNPEETPIITLMPKFQLSGEEIGDQFGSSVSNAGDINKDNYDDFIVTAPYLGAGTAYVFSGKNGEQIYRFTGEWFMENLGRSADSMGDINADGYPDIVIGSNGAAKVFSGLNGNLLYSFGDINKHHIFGCQVSNAGDVNADGVNDILVGNISRNTAKVFSGLNGNELYTVHGDNEDGDFGLSASGAGDINNDGYADFIIGDKRHNENHGKSYVYSGETGELLYSYEGMSKYDWYGISVSGVGDVNSDDYDDFIVGALGESSDGRANRVGSARVYSGANGSVLHTLFGNESTSYFGSNVANFGDIDNDGYNDILIGGHYKSNYVEIFSGYDGKKLQTLVNDTTSNIKGNRLSRAGDVNFDGYPDVIVGSFTWFQEVDYSSITLFESSVDLDSDGIADDTDEDDDGDGISEATEEEFGSSDKMIDSDSDGLKDSVEINTYHTDPSIADSDEDGLSDYLEIKTYGTDPLASDSDSDNLSDGYEIEINTDPLQIDSDDDGLSDDQEVLTLKSNPVNPDTDGDGLSDSKELNEYETDLLLADTDGDGLSDDQEVLTLKSNPLNPDTDGDGLSDSKELHEYGTDLLLADTDGDGLDDGSEIINGSNPLIADKDKEKHNNPDSPEIPQKENANKNQNKNGGGASWIFTLLFGLLVRKKSKE